MGRRKLGTLTITSYDKLVFLALAKCHFITKDLATEYCHVGAKRLDRLERGGYLIRETAVVNDAFITVYRLSAEGQSYTKRNVDGVNKLYHGTGIRGAGHDLDLCRHFLTLPYEAQKAALVESEITDTWGAGIKGYTSPPDMLIPEISIVLDNQTIYIPMLIIESRTKNYSDEEIEAKERYVEQNIEVAKEVIHYVGVKKP